MEKKTKRNYQEKSQKYLSEWNIDSYVFDTMESSFVVIFVAVAIKRKMEWKRGNKIYRSQ